MPDLVAGGTKTRRVLTVAAGSTVAYATLVSEKTLRIKVVKKRRVSIGSARGRAGPRGACEIRGSRIC